MLEMEKFFREKYFFVWKGEWKVFLFYYHKNVLKLFNSWCFLHSSVLVVEFNLHVTHSS